MQVRAFGLFLHDLAQRIDPFDAQPHAASVPELNVLVERCLEAVPSERPAFVVLAQKLRTLLDTIQT